MAVGNRRADHATPLYSQKSALRSVVKFVVIYFVLGQNVFILGLFFVYLEAEEFERLAAVILGNNAPR
jgi:hypothetical protein